MISRDDLEGTGYDELLDILHDAFKQAYDGKGKIRHGHGNQSFLDQPWCLIRRQFPGFLLGQAMKKLLESDGLWNPNNPKQRYDELLGAIVYIALECVFSYGSADFPKHGGIEVVSKEEIR